MTPRPESLALARRYGWSWPLRSWPQVAAEAAMRKARDYHCRRAYYAASGGARGPSGALRGAGAAFGGLPSPFKGPGIGYEPSGR